MKSDAIIEVVIDTAGRLCVTPASMEFSLIYRAAMGVYWDGQGGFLHSPPPKELSYVQWFRQIVDAARDEYGCSLYLTPSTQWRGIESSVKDAILMTMGAVGA